MKYGITGCIGSGKSFVCKRLEAFGIHVYDCDAAAKRLMHIDKDLQRRLSEVIGMEVFPEGVMNKALLAQYLLASEENAQKIDNIVHPAVFRDFESSGLLWVESAILFECGMNKLVDKVVCITAPLETRIQRIMTRDGITREKAMEWVQRQMPQEKKSALSDYVIINDGDADIDEQLRSLKLV